MAGKYGSVNGPNQDLDDVIANRDCAGPFKTHLCTQR